VDYAALRADHADLDLYLRQLALTPVPGARAVRMAHLINAFNAWTLALVLDHLPSDPARWSDWSIEQAGMPLISVWKLYRFDLGIGRYSLDQLEREMLGAMGEPRTHFATACGTRSCPRLAGRPYLATTLEADLDEATAAFIADPERIRVRDGELLLDPLFERFSEDFDKHGGVRAFLRARVTDPAVKALLEEAALKPRFLELDRRLNVSPTLGAPRGDPSEWR